MSLLDILKIAIFLSILVGSAYLAPFMIFVYVFMFLVWLKMFLDERKVRKNGRDAYVKISKLDKLPGTKGKYESYLVEFEFQEKVYVSDAVPKKYLGNMEKIRVKYVDEKKLYFYDGQKVTMLFAKIKKGKNIVWEDV